MQFLYLNVLFFMLIPALMLMLLIVLKTSSYEKHFSKDALNKLSLNNKYFSKRARNIILCLALFLMIIALARPVINEKEQNIKEEKHSIVIALDISKSMLVSDVYPNRLTLAKKKIDDIINNTKDANLALILFAKSSFILSPLTQDFESLKILIENLDKGLNFDNGTNIYSALENANKLQKDFKNKNIIILSDGADKKSFKEEINYAKDKNIKVYTLAIGTKKGSPLKQKNGNYLSNNKGEIINLKLNENIKELSFKSEGAYINYTLNDYDVKTLLNEISKKSKKEQVQNKKIKTYTELFYYPLSLALLFILIAFSSLPKLKKTLLFISFILILNNTNLKAFEFDYQIIKEAEKNYKNKKYKEAIKKYDNLSYSEQQQYNLANSYYKNNEYKKAIDSYKNIKSDSRDLKFNTLHNLGNAYVKNNNLKEALRTYEDALKIKEEKQTRENLNEVKKALQKKKKKEAKKENQKRKSEKKKSKQENKKEEKEAKKNKQKQKQENEKTENKKTENKKNKQKQENEKNKSQETKKSKKNEISKLEEKKWLNKLKHYKTKPLLKKFKSNKSFQGENPW